MHTLSDSSGSFGYDEVPDEAGSAANAIKNSYKKLVSKANSAPLTLVFKHFGLRINEAERRVTCPFPAHKGGRESTASMYYFPQTNTFFCYGCKIGGKACEFVSNLKETTKSKAAEEIVKLFDPELSTDDEIISDNLSERLEVMLEFSTLVRNFKFIYKDEVSLAFIEKICSVYDDMNLKHNLSNEALKSMFLSLKNKIEACHGQI